MFIFYCLIYVYLCCFGSNALLYFLSISCSVIKTFKNSFFSLILLPRSHNLVVRQIGVFGLKIWCPQGRLGSNPSRGVYAFMVMHSFFLIISSIRLFNPISSSAFFISFILVLVLIFLGKNRHLLEFLIEIA